MRFAEPPTNNGWAAGANAGHLRNRPPSRSPS